MTKNGIVCNIDGRNINLDPKHAIRDCINFVSHAHSDHLPGSKNGLILSTRETKEIATLRGHELSNHVEKVDDFEIGRAHV